MTLNLQQYLKKYSTINSTFIDDFFGLYDNATDSNDFVINIENISKWLKSRKETIKDTLVKSYVVNVDYKIFANKIEKKRGRPKELILLTPDCFKRLCMSSRTDKANEVRTYFIELEKHINKYKNYIIDGLNKKVGILENNQKKIINTSKGVIYVLRTNLNFFDMYKIGKTKGFVNRLKIHNNSHADNVEVVFIYETDDIDGVEKCLKLALKNKQYRKRKEFYQVDLELIKQLTVDCDNLLLKATGNNFTHNSNKSKYNNVVLFIDK